MFKYLKQLTSLVAVVAVLFAFTTESMAAKKSIYRTQKIKTPIYSLMARSEGFEPSTLGLENRCSIQLS